MPPDTTEFECLQTRWSLSASRHDGASSLVRLRAQPCWIVRGAGVVGRRGRAEVRPMTGGTAEGVDASDHAGFEGDPTIVRRHAPWRVTMASLTTGSRYPRCTAPLAGGRSQRRARMWTRMSRPTRRVCVARRSALMRCRARPSSSMRTATR